MIASSLFSPIPANAGESKIDFDAHAHGTWHLNKTKKKQMYDCWLTVTVVYKEAPCMNEVLPFLP